MWRRTASDIYLYQKERRLSSAILEAEGVGICTRIENKQLIENTTRSKRTRLGIWRIGVRAVYVGMAANQTLTKLRSKREFAQLGIVTRFTHCKPRTQADAQTGIYFAVALLASL